VLHLEPIIGYLPPVDAMGKTSHEMAKAFNGKYNWRMSNLPFTGVSIMSYKEICGVVGILPEVGSHCGRLYDQEKERRHLLRRHRQCHELSQNDKRLPRKTRRTDQC
jgi:hypothetical protein